MGAASNAGVRRIYDDPAPADGKRVLVDRLWPRGVSKERADLFEWCKDIAPSTELREWYGHDPAKFDEFSADTGKNSLTLYAPTSSPISARWRSKVL